MSFWTLLYSFLLMPIQLLFEVVFSFAYTFTNEQIGPAIIALSLTINLLILPLYRRADAIQEEERLTEAKLHPGVSHIKKTFTGSEKTMMLQTYYRQNNYSPLFVLRSAVSLFLEIPFFIVAYRFLSSLDLMHGVSFGPIADLGAPDRLIPTWHFSINLLPILMTVINVISTIIFTKGYPVKTKVQLYVMAAFFLVFLYNSPSGLVFYWTLNNLFSLIKTIFYKIKNPQKVIRIILVIAGAAFVAFGIFSLIRYGAFLRMIIFAGAGILMCIPFAYSRLKEKHDFSRLKIKTKPNKALFRTGCVFLTVLTGILIPSATITASPQEFIIVGVSMHPIWYVVSSFLIAAGLFILWMSIFYYMFPAAVKVIIERLVIIASFVGIIDYLFFGNNFGTLSAELRFGGKIDYSLLIILINIAIVVAVSIGVLFLIKIKYKAVVTVVIAASVAMTCMSVINSVGIFQSVAEIDLNAENNEIDYELPLSKDGQNVIVMMLDRAMGEYIPYMMAQSPEMKKMYSGFTYYSNVVSFSGHTNMSTPSLFGGYEYTPIELNKRDKERLPDKHNEALKVMPTLFNSEGFDVTVCDPPYANYKEVPDLSSSIYDEYKNIKTYYPMYLTTEVKQQRTINTRVRNFFFYSLFKTSPVCFQNALYNNGNYHKLADNVDQDSYKEPFKTLQGLSKHTTVSKSKTGSFIMMNNEATHEDSPESSAVLPKTKDGSEVPGASELTNNGITLRLDKYGQTGAYQANVASIYEIGKWFDYLRENDLFDNTRIIMVSDHGYALQHIKELFVDDTYDHFDVNQRWGDVEFYYPLLMVKDFNSKGEFTESKEFMTIADVPTLATSDVIKDAVNPFTGKAINNSEKTAHDQYILASDKYSLDENNGTRFKAGRWYTVHDSIWDKRNWKLVEKDGVLP